jgi:hypothetical protein
MMKITAPAIKYKQCHSLPDRESSFCKGRKQWNAKKRKISINVIALMNHAVEKAYAATASRII